MGRPMCSVGSFIPSECGDEAVFAVWIERASTNFSGGVILKCEECADQMKNRFEGDSGRVVITKHLI